jgi:hypothetical protein
MNAQNVTVLPPSESAPPSNVLAVPSPPQLLAHAFASGATPEVLAKYMDLHERWQDRQALQAFNAAMADAKAEIPVITKNREVDFTSPKGRTNYKHEDLGEITRVVTPILAKHGITVRFRTSSVPGEPIAVTCIIRHRDGHSEENTLIAGRDDSGNKNSIQAIGSTVTYLQRYTLKAALGLAAAEDDDGRGNGNGTGEVISKAQADHIRAKIAELGIPLETFLNYMRAPSIDDIPARQLGKAMHAIGASKAAARAAPAAVKPAEDMTDFPEMPDNLRRAPQVAPNAGARR